MSKQDTTKDAKKVNPSHKAKKPEKKPRAFLDSNRLLLFTVTTVLILLVGFISLAGWQMLQQQQARINHQQQQLEQISRQQARIHQQLEKQLQQTLQQQANKLDNLKATMTAFLQRRRYNQRDWLIAEAEYLVKLANQRLILAADVRSSLYALRAADARLREVGNPRFIPLRQSIANDIQKLNSVTEIDVISLSLKLNAIQKQIENLPLKTPLPQTANRNQQPATPSEQTDSWQKLPATIWHDLIGLLKIQTHDEPVQPLLAPEQRFFLVQNLKLQLEQARLALINNQPVIYKDRLQQAQQWIKRYFDKENALTQSVIKNLSELAQTKITTTLPDISDSVNQLQLLHKTKIPAKKTTSSKKHTKPKKTQAKNKAAKPKTKSRATPKIKTQVKPPAKPLSTKKIKPVTEQTKTPATTSQPTTTKMQTEITVQQ